MEPPFPVIALIPSCYERSSSYVTGISYVTSDKSGVDDINIISTWPGAGKDVAGTWKTPTRIAYKAENTALSRNKWGFEVGPKLRSYSWTKLLLDKDAEAGEYDDPALNDLAGAGLLRLPNHRNAQGVCEDFLAEIYSYTVTILKRQITEETLNVTPMECWITLPAIWSDQAKQATLSAAQKAGFGSRTMDVINTIAEPEAAAIATLKKYIGPQTLNTVRVSGGTLCLAFITACPEYVEAVLTRVSRESTS